MPNSKMWTSVDQNDSAPTSRATSGVMTNSGDGSSVACVRTSRSIGAPRRINSRRTESLRCKLSETASCATTMPEYRVTLKRPDFMTCSLGAGERSAWRASRAGSLDLGLVTKTVAPAGRPDRDRPQPRLGQEARERLGGEPVEVEVALVLLRAVGDLAKVGEGHPARRALRDHRLHVRNDGDKGAARSQKRDPVGQEDLA